MGDVQNHSTRTLNESNYNTIQNHCLITLEKPKSDVHVDKIENHRLIHLNQYYCPHHKVTIGKVRNHTIITGECASLSITDVLENHSRICVTGAVTIGKTENACDVLEKKSIGEVAAYRKCELSGNPTDGTDV